MSSLLLRLQLLVPKVPVEALAPDEQVKAVVLAVIEADGEATGVKLLSSTSVDKTPLLTVWLKVGVAAALTLAAGVTMNKAAANAAVKALSLFFFIGAPADYMQKGLP